MGMFRVCPECGRMCGKTHGASLSGRFADKCPDCVAPLKGRFWYIDYRVNGVRKREAVSADRRFAEMVLAKRKTQIQEGKFFETKNKNNCTLREIVDDFLEYSRNNKRSYGRDEILARNFMSFFGERKCAEITPNLIEQYKGKRLNEDGRMPATVNRELTCLKSVFNWAIKNSKVTVNPVREVKMLKENNTRLRYLTKDEAQRLIENCPEHIKPIVITALLTGMRRGEILGLKWEDVNLTQGIITLKNTKSGRTRHIPISSQLMKVISECRDTSDGVYVFCNGDGKPYATINSMFQNIVKRAGLDDFHFHDLRHTAASYMVMSGTDIVTVKEILGHATLEMTMRYAHLSPFHKRDAMEKLASKMDSFWTVRDSVAENSDSAAHKKVFKNEVEMSLRRGRLVV